MIEKTNGFETISNMRGAQLLDNGVHNKSTAFTLEERNNLFVFITNIFLIFYTVREHIVL